MSITIAGIRFENHGYDARGDVLYLDVEGYCGPPAGAHTSDEGHNIEFDKAGRVIGMTIVGLRWYLKRDGVLTITLPVESLTPQERAQLSSTTLRATEAELAPALASVA
jgi:uncharacterized protein YuzE